MWTEGIVKRAQMRNRIEKFIDNSLIRIEKELKEALNEIYNDIEIKKENGSYTVMVHDRKVEFTLDDISKKLTSGKKNVYNFHSKLDDIEENYVYEIITDEIKQKLERL